MSWEFCTDPEFAERLAWIRAFMDDEVLPLETLGLGLRDFDRVAAPLRQRVKDAGLWAPHLPPELGGGGFGQVKLALVNELLGESLYGPFTFGTQAPDSGNAELLALYGTDPQKERWLYPLLAGEIYSAFSMTEPGAGADPTRLATVAERDGDEWVITGHKWFTSSASVSDVLIVMALTEPEAPPHERYSMIIVPTGTPGVEIVRDIPTMADPAHELLGGHAEVRYDGVRVPLDHLLGEAGGGFALAQARLGPGRIHHCMRWLGQANRAFRMLCERAVSRETHGSALGDKQIVQAWIAESAAAIEGARLMTLRAAWEIDRNGPAAARDRIAMIKFAGAKVLHDVIDRALQAHGSLGFSGDMPLEAMYREARAARLVDGPDEVHKVAVARRILRGYNAVEVPTEHVPTRRAAAEERFGPRPSELVG